LMTSDIWIWTFWFETIHIYNFLRSFAVRSGLLYFILFIFRILARIKYGYCYYLLFLTIQFPFYFHFYPVVNSKHLMVPPVGTHISWWNIKKSKLNFVIGVVQLVLATKLIPKYFPTNDFLDVWTPIFPPKSESGNWSRRNPLYFAVA